MLHGTAALLSHSLPDMELSAIYSTLTSPATSSLLILTNSASKTIGKLKNIR